MCLPSRFRKDLLRAAKQDENGRIALYDMQKVIANISMQHRITEQEMETIFQEMGESGKISADHLMKII
jgi:Ca2+-binding EF-hand superfamily protein